METTTRILLMIMILLLGTTFTLIGIQIFFILREIRENARKINAILEDFRRVSTNIATGAEQAGEIVESLKSTLSLVNIGKSFWQVISGSKKKAEDAE